MIRFLTAAALLSLSVDAMAWEAVGCKEQEFKAGLAKIEASPEPFRLAHAVTALRESCKYSPAVEKIMIEWTRAQPDKLPAWDHKAALDDPGSWKGACHGGAAALPERDKLHTVEGRRQVYQQCNLGRFTFANEDRFVQGNGAVVLTVITAHLFQQYNMPRKLGNQMIRALGGIPEKPGQ